MEELRLLVEMVADLPHMALWVIAAFFAYKVIVVGSIYRVIRFIASGIFKVCQTYLSKPPKPVIVKTKDGFSCVDQETADLLSDLLKKVANSDSYTGLRYLHASHARDLTRAWEAYQANKTKAKQSTLTTEIQK